jgi:hypothetical protein
MFNTAHAQPKIIGELKTVLENIGESPLLPGEIQSSVKNGLMLIAEHQQKPQRFKAAMDSATDKILAMPMEQLEKLGQPYVDSMPVIEDVEVRERLRFTATLSGMERVDQKKADAFIKANPKEWGVWQECAKFWRSELS